MNSKAKGARTAIKACEWLESQGWLPAMVDNNSVRSATRFRSTDMFSLFDAVAVKPGEPALFCQFTTNRSHTHRDYIEWSKSHMKCVQMTWHDRKGFVVDWYEDGVRTTEDLRK